MSSILVCYIIQQVGETSYPSSLDMLGPILYSPTSNFCAKVQKLIGECNIEFYLNMRFRGGGKWKEIAPGGEQSLCCGYIEGNSLD